MNIINIFFLFEDYLFIYMVIQKSVPEPLSSVAA